MSDRVVQRRRRRWPWILAVVVTCCGGGVAYPIVKIRWARRQARGLCGEIEVGGPVAGIEARARERGLRVIKSREAVGHPGKIMTWEGFGFGRWFCDVEYHDGRVLSKEVFFLD